MTLTNNQKTEAQILHEIGKLRTLQLDLCASDHDLSAAAAELEKVIANLYDRFKDIERSRV